MIDGNISMEEDTELRDLVVQTLENNGVLAKVRAELRASVFLALEEQDSVMNPEPLLNKTVKQYLSNSEGKLLFCLVREFLEYFGLDCTISVYDPETYFGKEYNYVGRNKLCEELGIDSTEPLLGEILKNSINGAFNSTLKSKSSNRHDETTDEASTNFANATFEVSVPKVIHNESVSSSNDNDSSEKLESNSEQSPKVPINVTITDKKCKEAGGHVATDTSDRDKQRSSLRENAPADNNDGGIASNRNNNVNFDKTSTCAPTTASVAASPRENDTIATSNQTGPLNKSESLIKFDDSIVIDTQTNQSEDITKQNSINSLELSIGNNVQNKKPLVNAGGNFGKTIYFDEIIVDGERRNVSTMNKAESFLEDLPAINQKAGSIFGDLPPLNGKKANINDLKELMDIGLATDGIDNYEEDFVSSASGSANEQSPAKEPDKMDSSRNPRAKREDKAQSGRTEDLSEEIEEMDEILSSTSCIRQDLTEYRTREEKKREIVRSLRQATSSVDDACDSNGTERSFRARGKTRVYPKKVSVFVQADANKRGDNNECYRCEHFSNIPSSLPQPSCPRTAGLIGQCEADISFVQAIVWLKSSIACVSQLSVEQLQRVFHRQWGAQDDRSEKKGSDNKQRAKRLKSPPAKKPPTRPEMIDTQDIFEMLTPRNAFGSSRGSTCENFLRFGPRAISGEAQVELFSLADESSTHKPSARDKCASWIVESKGRESSPESDAISMAVEELLLDSEWDMSLNETYDRWAEYQIGKRKVDDVAECSAQPASERAKKRGEAAGSSKADPGNEADAMKPRSLSGDNFAFLVHSTTPVCDVSIYRVQIILELCNSVSVSVPIIDHLIARLKPFLVALSRDTKTRLRHATVQLHLVFYALNIALRKYRTVVPNARRTGEEIAIPHVTDLWKTRYIDEELEYARLNVNDAEKRWRAALEDCASAFTPRFVRFAEKSLSLAHTLIPQ
ncbi:PREDICTED: uncharacterized protein LOC106743097 [Dinoponera quadriceps]|uniref:Uncharacterized protein LOC106743097 n=1 Tax=Dinoponera quadriceps TaxID=609295 RepID=A0A6P3X1A3_DINQU|nr:PREDICTED: uncharacterized protein LOC106743097 [Dinoponera quadriceps]